MSIFSYKYYEKLKQKKYRREENKFLIEGDNLVFECLESDRYKDSIEAVFVRRDYENAELLKKIYAEIPDVRVEDLTESVFNKLSETVSQQGIIACVRNIDTPELKNSFNSDLIIALDNINDPGNLGTIIRTCYWFGVKEILLGNDSVDHLNPKVIRASQGAVFHTDLYKTEDLRKSLMEIESKDRHVYLMDVDAEMNVSDLRSDTLDKCVLVFGNESNGISKEIISEKNFKSLKIKGFSECESLNVAVSAGIAIYEFRNVIEKN
ncbi:MAG: RNA methyltransferase [Ignavibacteria bacterium]